MKLKKTERGWAGHFICSQACSFRRNTLLECGDKRIVVSTVGSYLIGDGKIETVGIGRYYETMAFRAVFEDPYWEADISEQINFDTEWAIAEIGHETDKHANDMHEAVVKELSRKIKKDD